MVKCGACGLEGHRSTSLVCKVKCEKEEEVYVNFKSYIVSNKLFDISSIDFDDLGNRFNISKHKADKYHKRIFCEDPELFLDIDEDLILSEVLGNNQICVECGIEVPCINETMMMKWGGDRICGDCWFGHSKDREKLWLGIHDYLKENDEFSNCGICDLLINYGNFPASRFHCDHKNMFTKTQSICGMVQDGENLEIILLELEKCHILCYVCHNLVTYMEKKISLSRIKSNLTRNLNQNIISQDEHDRKLDNYRSLCDVRMLRIYDKLKSMMRDFRLRS